MINFQEILHDLASLKRPDPIEGGERVYYSDLKNLAKRIGKNHSLATELWMTNNHDAKHLAVFLTNFKRFDSNILDNWVQKIVSWGTCDSFCGKIVCFTPYAKEKVLKWVQSEDLYVRRAGFATITYLCLKKCKKTDEELLDFLPLIEKYAFDERDHVRKAVNWALREFGKRNAFFNQKALELSEKLQKSPDKNVQWIGKHRIKEILNRKFSST